jgi:hypothetical protein
MIAIIRRRRSVASVVPLMEIESARVVMGFLPYHTGLPGPSLQGMNLARE